MVPNSGRRRSAFTGREPLKMSTIGAGIMANETETGVL